jgi:hypothetical protein
MTMNPLLNITRRLLNPLGIDVVRYDPARRGVPAANGPRAKLPVPARIIIGGGDYEYGSLWHNIDFVTAGYADKYKHLPRNIDIAHDLTSGEPFPIEDDTLLAAYTSHGIEHLKDARPLLPPGEVRLLEVALPRELVQSAKAECNVGRGRVRRGATVRDGSVQLPRHAKSFVLRHGRSEDLDVH